MERKLENIHINPTIMHATSSSQMASIVHLTFRHFQELKLTQITTKLNKKKIQNKTKQNEFPSKNLGRFEPAKRAVKYK